MSSSWCECDTCTPQCNSLCPTCLPPGGTLPEPHRDVQCYQVVDLPSEAGWASSLTPVSPDECVADAPAYMFSGQYLENFHRDPQWYNGPERDAHCPTVPTCTKLVWGVGAWSTLQPWTTEQRREFAAFCAKMKVDKIKISTEECECMTKYLETKISYDDFGRQMALNPLTPEQVTDQYIHAFTLFWLSWESCSPFGKYDFGTITLPPWLLKLCEIVHFGEGKCSKCTLYDDIMKSYMCMTGLCFANEHLMKRLKQISLSDTHSEEAQRWAAEVMPLLLSACPTVCDGKQY